MVGALVVPSRSSVPMRNQVLTPLACWKAVVVAGNPLPPETVMLSTTFAEMLLALPWVVSTKYAPVLEPSVGLTEKVPVLSVWNRDPVRLPVMPVAELFKLENAQ